MSNVSQGFQVIGTTIYDPNGEEFIIRGANMFAWEGTSNIDSYMNDWGFNALRVPNYLLGSYGQAHPNQDNYANNEAIANAVTDNDGVVIFDAHDRIGGYYQGNEKEILLQYWRDMAQKFRDNPNVWFNLSNEPGNAIADPQTWVSYHREIIDVIRAEGANNIIVVNGEAWGQDYFTQTLASSALDVMEGNENVIFDIHIYDQWNGTNKQDNPDNPGGYEDIRAYLTALQNLGIPMMIGEYGSENQNANINTLDASRRAVEAANELGIGRMVWTMRAQDNNDVTYGPGGHGEHFDGTNTEILTDLGKIAWGDLQRTPDKINGTDGDDVLTGGNGNYLLDGGAGNDRLEAGNDSISQTFLLEVGTFDTNKVTTEGFETVNFGANFSQNPLVFSKVQTYNDTDFVRTRQQNTTTGGFQIALEEEEALNQTGHGTETIGWLAIESGSNDYYLEAGNTGNTISHQFQTLNLNTTFNQTPRILSNIATYNGSDPSGLRLKNLNTDGVELKVDEEQSKDSETWHATEEVNYLAFNGTEGSDFIRDVFGNVVGEMGTIQLNEQSKNIDLLFDYVNPVVFARVNSYVGSQPVAVRIQDIQSDNFTAFLEEPEYLDGQHWDETVDYFVFEKGEWLISQFADFDVLIGGTGNDTLVGGNSADKFVFNSPNEGIDTIENFSIAQGDKIVINADNFGGGLNPTTYSGSPLLQNQFYVGSSATESSHRFIYNDLTGMLSFDVDGVGGQSQVDLAVLSPGLALSSNDISRLGKLANFATE